ncbi:MAG: DUF1874 domain-containing protein [Ardenticatenales bacterium]|nr:DUF1874 domain-containing protein [Ardenticatenales bacterium]
MKLINAFSANMLHSLNAMVSFTALSLDEAQETMRVDAPQSAVGHESTAAVFSAVLGEKVDANRVSVTLRRGDKALLGQYRGPRLEEGATELPDGATIEWALVEVK